MDRTPENVDKYVQFIAECQKTEKLLPFDRSGVAALVEHGSRMADHQEKLTARLSSLSDVMREASYWARKDGANFVRGQHVAQAINREGEPGEQDRGADEGGDHGRHANHPRLPGRR